MAENLQNLARNLDEGIDRQQLIDALYAIRAPRTLEGIVPMCRQFRDWRHEYQDLNSCPDLTDYGNRLAVLDRIADLDIGDSHLMGRTIGRIKNPWTPLYNVTGDSVIGELLLIRPEALVDSVAFRRVSVWLLWQAQRFSVRHTSRASYETYLASNSGRFANRFPGRRLYDAYLALRPLAENEASAREKLSGFLALASELTPARSAELAGLFKLATERLAMPDYSRLRLHTMEQKGWSTTEFDDAIDEIQRVVPPAFGRLLNMVWGGDASRTVGVRRARRAFFGRDLYRPEIIHGERLTEILQRVDADNVHAGTVVEFYPRTPDRRRRRQAEGGEADLEDDPEEPSQQEPPLSIFLADGDELIRGYYAAKGQQNGVEYGNALLRWSKWTLSRPAVDAVVHLVAGSPEAAEARLDRYARVAIGLSLLTGRSLEQVASFRITNDPPEVDEEAPVAICASEHRLYLYPGQPDLRKPLRETPPFCHPKADVLCIALPESWWPLVDGTGPVNGTRRKAIEARARQRLQELGGSKAHAPAFRVTERGLRYALQRELAEHTRGDLGAQQVIVDGAEVNARNIIHYASYDARRVQAWWRKAAESLVGPLPEVDERRGPSVYVGAQHAFDVPQLAKYFHTIRERAWASQEKQDWPRLFNLMTLYLSYWLGLGVAGRRTRVPVPSVLLDGGWALVADKHRIDGSTDRLVPITKSLREQIDAYIAFASSLCFTAPKLDPIAHTERGSELRLQYNHLTKGVVPYQPKYQEQNEQLTPLPANWGRKVLRSESGRLPGRYRDAEMGHWVRGRHAWDATSTFDAADFRARWLALQGVMETRLGFKVIDPAPYWKRHRRSPLRPTAETAGSPASRTSASRPLPGKVDIEALLREVDAARVEALVDAKQMLEPNDALDLVRRAVEAQQRESIEWQRQVAETACAFIRDRKKIPIFATKPRPLFSNKVVLSADAVQTLAYLQQCVHPLFSRDLECLPSKQLFTRDAVKRQGERSSCACDNDSQPEGAHGKADPNVPRTTDMEPVGVSHAVDERARAIELGRLVMVAIWRLGLARWKLIESWLRALHENAPVLAQGPNRYMVVQVRADGSREVMQRTVFLDDFTSAHLVVERESIRRDLVAPLFRATTPPRRRARVDRSLRAYLRLLNPLCERVSLTSMTAAASQSIMLHGAPVVAAYARGEINTWDLGDGELRRLAGLEPSRKLGAAKKTELPATKQVEPEDTHVPLDLLNAHVPVAQMLRKHRSGFKSYWREHLAPTGATPPMEMLLRRFAIWMLDRSGTDEEYPRVSEHEKRHIAGRVEVVAYALLGYTAWSSGPGRIDGDILSELQEASRNEFPDRLQHGAWFQFHRYLADEKADHAGFEIGPLGPAPERAVSAKILRADELAKVRALLVSTRSQIGNAALRASAQRHAELMATYGMRRAESAFLRTLDFQQDLCRVQAYGAHTLKTAWAERILPVGFAGQSTQDWMREAHSRQYERLIDPASDMPANPDNFFDALNGLIKKVTQDPSMGSHHLRHTVVNRLVLTLLRSPAGLDGVADDFPWMKDLMIEPARMHALLGSEGDAGQGMRAVAALVGHSHPTTTIRHYVHVLGIALHGVLRKADTLDLSRSFENRIGGKSTLQRWTTQIRAGFKEGAGDDSRRRTLNRALRDRIEQRFNAQGIARDETLYQESDAFGTGNDESVAGAIRFDRLEQVDQSLRDGQNRLHPGELKRYMQGLRWLASVKTGKRGEEDSDVVRHPLQEIRAGVWLPLPLAAGSATEAADTLCKWLEALRTDRPEDFLWLVEKWVHASEHERSRIRLDNAGEVERARALEDPQLVAIDISGAIVPLQRVRLTTKEVPRMRIKARDGSGRIINRDTKAARWVLSYVAAYKHVHQVSDAFG
jgi:integrase